MSDGSLLFDTKLDTGGLASGLGKVGSVAATAFGGISAAVGAGATAIGALTKSSLDAVSSLEQNVGGVQTLFKDSADKVIASANEAYKTAGMSANDYMSTVTSFSASLLQGLNGDTAKAADVSNQAIVDMSDNANKMGTSIELIQNAYQGFAKQNYTMLDNLKLGYGGTAAEMARLINDTGVMGKDFTATAKNVNSVSFDKIIEAIHKTQDSMGITGTTAKEAATTIEGSISSMKASWDNFLAGSGTVDELVDSVKTAAGVVVDNLSQIIPRLAEGLPELAEQLGSMIPDLFNQILPPIIEGGTSLINGIVAVLPTLISTILPSLITGVTAVVQSLVAALPGILSALASVIPQLITAIMTMLPLILQAGIDIIVQLANGLASAIPTLLPQIVDLVVQIANTLIENLPLLITAAITLFLALVEGLLEALPQIIESLPTLISAIIDALIEAIPLIIDCGVQLFVALIENLPAIIEAIVKAAPQIVDSLVKGFLELKDELKDVGTKLMQKLGDGLNGMMSNLVASAKSIGGNIVDGLWNGIKSGWDWLTGKVSDLASSLFDSAKKALGIASPSKKFRWIGEMCVAGFDEGLDGLMDGSGFGDAVNASLSTVSANTGTNTAVSDQTTGNSQTFNFYDTQTSPDAIRRKVQNTMTFGLAGAI